MRWLTLLLRLLISVAGIEVVAAATYLVFLKGVCGRVAADWSAVRDLDSFADQIANTDIECIGSCVETPLGWLRMLLPLGLGVLAAAGLFVAMTKKNWPQVERKLW